MAILNWCHPKNPWTSLFKKIWKIGLHQLFHGVFSMKHLTFLHIWNSSRWFWGEFVARFWCSDLQNHPDTTSFQFPFCSPASRWSHDIDAGGSLKPQLQTFQEYNFQTFPKSGISSKKFQVSAYFFIPNLARICDVKVNGWVFSLFSTHACWCPPVHSICGKDHERKKQWDSRAAAVGVGTVGRNVSNFWLGPQTILKVIFQQVLRCEDMADWENSFDRIFQQTNAWQGFVIQCYVVCYSRGFGYPTCISKNVPNIWKTLKDDVGRIHSPVWNQPQELYLHTQMHEHEIGFACKSRTCFLIDFVGMLQWALYRKKQFWEKFSFGLKVKSQPQKSQILNAWSIESIANIWGLVI